MLDFFDLQNAYLEKDVEDAILRVLEIFILELGKGFAFVERQKRMIIDGEDFYLDLLFLASQIKKPCGYRINNWKFSGKISKSNEIVSKMA